MLFAAELKHRRLTKCIKMLCTQLLQHELEVVDNFAKVFVTHKLHLSLSLAQFS